MPLLMRWPVASCAMQRMNELSIRTRVRRVLRALKVAMASLINAFNVTCLVLLDEADELRALALDRLARLVEQRHDEVEEVALPQVRRRLLLVVRASDAASARVIRS